MKSREYPNNKLIAVTSGMCGPFHRLQPATLNDLMERTGMAGGKPAKNIFGGGGTPSVKAFDGALPQNQRGLEFYTAVKPTSHRPVPGTSVFWYRGTPGVVDLDIANDVVGIPITITVRVD